MFQDLVALEGSSSGKSQVRIQVIPLPLISLLQVSLIAPLSPHGGQTLGVLGNPLAVKVCNDRSAY